MLKMRERAHIHSTVNLGDTYLDKNVYIDEGTYICSGQIFAGNNSKVKIRKFCAIGYNVHIKARTHDSTQGTTPSEKMKENKIIEKNIIIGDYCWIGDNVFIDAGVEIGEHVIIGANAVVIKDIPPYKVVGGVPAKILYDRKDKIVDEK